MKNAYSALKEAQQKRVNALPIMFAFSMQQFNEGMARLGLAPDDTNKIYKLGGGGFYRREDSELIFSTFEQNEQEMKAAIAADEDGSGFIKDMFYYELANHEYCITYDLDPTLDALGLTFDEVMASPALVNGLSLAKKAYLKDADENEWY